MNRNRLLIAFGSALLAGTFAACGGTDSAEEALEDKSTTDVLKDAAEDEYTPPEDGHLTEAQVEMYIQVRERELELTKAAGEKLKDSSQKAKEADQSGESVGSFMKGMQALQDLGAFMTADIRAAQELGFNTAEYQWVKGQVMLAGVQSWADEMQKSLGQFATEGTQESPEDPEAEGHRYNAELLKKYQVKLDTLEEEMQKYQQEEDQG